MKIQKFTAATEHDAISRVKDELGLDAVILSIKKIQPRGLAGLFKKSRVEVTAAFEDKKIPPSSSPPPVKQALPNLEVGTGAAAGAGQGQKNIVKDFKIQEQQVKIQNLEEKLTLTEELLKTYSTHIKDSGRAGKASIKYKDNKYSNTVLELFYESLSKNGVIDDVIDVLLDGLENFENYNNSNINTVVKIVYNRIVNMLGNPEPIESDAIVSGEDTKVVICMGPTGVGKTTTIAKLSSYFILSKEKKVSLITADTYRVAAVEQLKTYGDILGVDVSVVYNPEDLVDALEKACRYNDMIFIDTAGRSHKNMENVKELERILMQVPQSEKFLVLSTTTKYEDLIDIMNTYSDLTDYKIIFTKLDETTTLGSVLNITYLTGRPLSYITCGQEVPDDIRIIQPEIIAKSLLGSSDV